VVSPSRGPPPLQLEAILAGLDPNTALAVEVAESIDSTNDELSRRAGRGDIHRHVLIAERQIAGRGRRGRPWTSVAGGSLTFSIGWRFDQGAGQLGGVTLAAGLAIVRALEATGYRAIALKWPNDLVHRGSKLGGVLVELAGNSPGPSLAIVGVGINVLLPAHARRGIEQSVTDLATVSGDDQIDRNALLACILGELAIVLEAFARDGFEPLRAAWELRHAFQRKRVEVSLPDGNSMRGEVAGVDAGGALLLDEGGRRLRLVSGEVSLARLER
jgi:BirA family transcriptional regulator, biotin operon repressor / biotin---[acetyl-CoA-carboxylase] ligase